MSNLQSYKLYPFLVRSRQSTPVNTKPLLEGLDEGRDEQFEVATYVQSTTANIDTMENNGQGDARTHAFNMTYTVKPMCELSNGNPWEKDSKYLYNLVTFITAIRCS